MTRSEFLNLTAFITSLYPDKSPFKAGDMQETALNAWYIMLEDMPYTDAADALKKHIATSVYFPTVADIRREYDNRTKPKPKTALQAYINVKKAIQKYGFYQPEETYAMLDKQEQQALTAFGFVRFNNAPDNEFTQREFEKYYNAVCSDLVVV